MLHLYSYRDVRAAVTDSDLLTMDTSELGERGTHHITVHFTWGVDERTLSGQPGRHSALRRVAEPLLSSDAVTARRPALVAAADTAISAVLAGDGAVDLYHDLAVPYSLAVACGLVGLEPAEAATLVDQQRAMADLVTAWPPPRVPETDALLEAIHQRAAPTGTVIDLAMCAHARGQISRDEMLAQAWGHVQAATLTSASAATAMVGLLVEHGHWSGLRAADPEVAARAADEAVRFAAVFPVEIKVARVAHDRAGHSLAAGQPVAVWLSAADRDPAVNGAAGERGPDPGRFDPTRWPNRTLAYSAGPHFCPGSRLARAELAVLLERLHACADVELRPGWTRYARTEDGHLTAPVLVRAR